MSIVLLLIDEMGGFRQIWKKHSLFLRHSKSLFQYIVQGVTIRTYLLKYLINNQM